MAFPEKNWLGFKKGWEDLGKIDAKWVRDDVYTQPICTFCRTPIRIGREKQRVFKYCPRCLMDVTGKNND